MRAECIPRHRLATDNVPLEASHDGVEVFAEHGTNPDQVRNPSDDDRNVLQNVRTHRYAQGAMLIIDRSDPPGYRRHAATGPTNFQVIAHAFMPLAKVSLINPPAEIMDFVL